MEETEECYLSNDTWSEHSAVRLASASIDITINGFIANVVSTLRYKNTQKNSVEVIYLFPVDDQSAVYHFEAQIQDRIITAECQERNQAKETYEDALSSGYCATLLEETELSSDIFRFCIGNLPPDTSIVIKFGYVTELSLQPDGRLRFILPTVLNPRYSPTIQRVDGRKDQQPVNFELTSLDGHPPYVFHINAKISNPGKVLNVEAGKDDLIVTFNSAKTEAQASLAKLFMADHDFSLDITFLEPCKPHIIMEKGQSDKEGILKHDVLMLNFFPELNETLDFSCHHEFIFVVDQSGSMWKCLEETKAALLLFLKSLPNGCYFNIVGFGSEFKLLFPSGSCEYSEESLKDGLHYQETMMADLGGTEILAPLQHIYRKPPMPTHMRQIFVLTDGDVDNTEAVIELVKQNSHNTRLFSFGIGNGASTALVRGVARAGRGKAVFVNDCEELQPLVIKTLKAAMQTAITDIRLDWELQCPQTLIQLPTEIPAIFSGDRLIVYNIVMDDKLELKGSVQLKGLLGERDFELTLNVNPSLILQSNDATQPIHRLAAKTQIAQLQDENKDGNKTAIVLLSTCANIVSKHTSMVGVDKGQKQQVADQMLQHQYLMFSKEDCLPIKRDGVRRTRWSSRSRSRSRSAGTRRSRSRSRSAGTRRSRSRSRSAGTRRSRSRSRSAGTRRSKRRARSARTRRSRSRSRSAGTRRSRSRSRSTDTHAGKPRSEMSAESSSRVGKNRMQSRSRAGERSPRYEACIQLQDDINEDEKNPDFMAFISLQNFSGQWKLNSDLASALLTTPEILLKSVSLKSADVWATVVVIAYLEEKFSDRKDEWELVLFKARQWLEHQDLEGHSLEDLTEKGRIFIRTL